jgi:dTDP-4-dehydrorhamnose reductase
MRVLVTGGRGQLGRELSLTHGDVIALNHSECDITDSHSVASALDRIRPDAVINAAAWTRVDAAETEVDAARLVNAVGPERLAVVTAERGIALLHVSTDFVFGNGSGPPITEEEVPDPQSVYGLTKLEGEEAVRRHHSGAQIVRTSWLFGQDGPNFILTMLRLAAGGRPLRVVADQWGSPTWTGHLAPALLRLLELGVPGTFHLTGSGQTTWHGLASAALTQAGYEVEVAPITTEDYPTPAQRPRYSVLANQAWADLGQPALPQWEDGVTAYVAERGLHSG